MFTISRQLVNTATDQVGVPVNNIDSYSEKRVQALSRVQDKLYVALDIFNLKDIFLSRYLFIYLFFVSVLYALKSCKLKGNN